MSSYDDWLARSPADFEADCETCGAPWKEPIEYVRCGAPGCKTQLCEDCRIRCEGCNNFFCGKHAATYQALRFCAECFANELHEYALTHGKSAALGHGLRIAAGGVS